MSPDKPRKIIPTADRGFIHNLVVQVKLILRLMADRRVNPFLKLIPLGAIVYFISPIDLAVGPIDDAAVVGLGMYLFVELCPQNVVKEHLEDLNSVLPAEWRDAPGQPPANEDVIEGEFHDPQEGKS